MLSSMKQSRRLESLETENIYFNSRFLFSFVLTMWFRSSFSNFSKSLFSKGMGVFTS